MIVPLRETLGIKIENLKVIIDKPLSALPSLGAPLVPVILPIALIMIASFLKVAESTIPEVAIIAASGSVSREIIDFAHCNLLCGTRRHLCRLETATAGLTPLKTRT